MWDHIMGTNFTDQGGKKDTKREQQALEQAALVQCQIGKEFKDFSNQKKD